MSVQNFFHSHTSQISLNRRWSGWQQCYTAMVTSRLIYYNCPYNSLRNFLPQINKTCKNLFYIALISHYTRYCNNTSLYILFTPTDALHPLHSSMSTIKPEKSELSDGTPQRYTLLGSLHSHFFPGTNSWGPSSTGGVGVPSAECEVDVGTFVAVFGASSRSALAVAALSAFA